MLSPKLETKRLILKRGTYDDYAKVYEYDFGKLRDIAGEFEYVKQDLELIKGYEKERENAYDWIIYLKEKAWNKNGVDITTYELIMSKERYNELYKEKTR